MRQLLVAGPITLIVLLSFAGGGVSAKSATARRLGNNSEGSTLISTGGRVELAVLDGYDVFAVNLASNPNARLRKLFDVSAHAWSNFPSGIAYLSGENAFAFGDQGSPDEIVVFNANGRVIDVRPVQYLPGTPPVLGTETLLGLDAGAPFPNTLARVVFLADGTPSIEIMTPAGVVLHEIAVVGLPPDETYVTGLAFVSPDRFLVTTASPNIWPVALDGTVAGGPVAVSEASDIEGIVALPNGGVYANDYTAGVLWALDASLARRPSLDRHFEVGLGLTRAFDAVWDPLTGGLIVNALDRDHASFETAVVSGDLKSRQVLFPHDITPGLAMLGDGSLATCQFFGPAAVLHYSRSGVLLDSLSLLTVPGLPPVRCMSIAYLSSIDAYALRLRGAARAQTVYLVSRAGVFLGSFTVAAPIVTLATSPGSNGDHLLVWGPPQLRTYGVSGALLSTQTLQTAPLVAPAGFAALPGGGYALLDPNNSEVAIYLQN
jgi:hypothetical protein